jgi:lipid-A-disaccharide synthase
MELTVHYRQMAFMGFVAVLANLRTISRLMAHCKEDIQSFQPDVVILIDYAGFNMRMARFAKSNGYSVFYYISPKVWAWNTGRAWKLKASVDRMFCILPFEPPFFRSFDWEVDYVGNPVLDAVKSFQPTKDFSVRHQLDARPIVAVLPGSRKIELQRMTPVLVQVIRNHPQYQFVVAAVDTLPAQLYEPLRAMPQVKLVFEQTYDLLSHARAAIVTSGTAALETGLFRVPQVVIYRAASIEYFIGIRFVKVKFISLVNLIANRQVIRELLQHEMTAENISGELKRLVEVGIYRAQMLNAYEEIYRQLDIGSASQNTARLMVNYLSNKK